MSSVSAKRYASSGLLILVMTGCEQAPSTEKAARLVASATSPAASAGPPAVSSAPPPLAPPQTLACKASGKLGQHSLGTHAAELTGGALTAFGDDVFALVTQRNLARIAVVRFPRDGSGPSELGSLAGVGGASHLQLHRAYAYFSHKNNVYRLPLGGGDTAKVLSGAGGPVALLGEHIFGLRCGAKERRDTLVRASLDGTSETVLAEVERSHALCEYQGLAIDGERVLIADWEGRRLLAIPLLGGAVTVLAKDHAFIREPIVFDGGVDFATSRGLFRLTKGSETATALADLGATPFCDIAYDPTDYFVFQGEPYQPTESIWRMSRQGGKPSKLWTYGNRGYEPSSPVGAEAGTGIEAVAVDEQCVYFAQQSPKGDSFTVFARHKPGPQ